MLFTHRRFETAAIGTGGLLVVAAIGLAITEAPSGTSGTARHHVAGGVRPPVAIDPTDGGAAAPGLQVTIPGRQVTVPVRTPAARGVRGQRASVVREVTAGAVTVPAGRATVAGPQPAPAPAARPGNAPGHGAVIGARLTLLGMVVGAQATVS